MGVKRIPQFKSIQDMCSDPEFNLKPGVVDSLVHHGKFVYESGQYAVACDILKHYRSMMAQDVDQPMTQKHVSCIWGSLACLILNADYREATELILKLDDYLDKSTMSKKEILQQRTWLLHWCLWPVFKDEPDAAHKAADFFLHEKNLSIISLSC